MRLNKLISELGIASRREADFMIEKGDITVNGQRTILGQQIDPDLDKMAINGKEIDLKKEELVYYALYKPTGVVTTSDDEKNRKTVLALVPRKPRVYPIGRLDMNSEGLLLLTNDGELTQTLTHPSFEHEKEYNLKVKNQNEKVKIDCDVIRKSFLEGMDIDGKLMKADKISIQRMKDNCWLLSAVIHTGYNRQLRKMCAKIGLEVITLTRIRIGKLSLLQLDLKPGQYKTISKEQIID